MSGPLVQAVGWALLHLLWQGVLVAAILAAVLALLQRQSANARYLASCGALFLLVVLGVATAYQSYDPIRTTGFTIVPSLTSGSPEPITSDVAAATGPAWRDAFSSATMFANSHLTEIVAIWLAGVLILSIRLIVGWIAAHRLTTRRSHEAGDGWQHALNRLAAALQLARPIRLLESAAVEVPTVIGWVRPVVLLPVASLSGLSIQQVEMILAHEMAHIRRHDFIVNLMQSVVETLLFYHPAVWWISRRIRVEREHCCDDLAVSVFGDPLLYARALTRFEELRLDAAQSVIAANGGSLLDRIRRLVVARAESASWSSRWAAGAALLTVVVAILIAPALPLFASHDDPVPPKPPTAPQAKKQTVDPNCDKATAPHVSVDVAATTEESADDEADNDPEVAVTPRPAPVAVAMPHIAIPAVHVDVAGIVSSALEESSAAIAAVAAENKVLRHQRRAKIGASGKLSVDDLITLRTAGVDQKYIEQMRGAGLGELSLDDLVALGMQGVTAAYIKEMAAAGYPHLNVHELIELRETGVDPAFVKSLAEAGYSSLSAKELIRLKMSGVDANFIRELAKYRTK